MLDHPDDRAILMALYDYRKQYGGTPSMRELAYSTGISSTSMVSRAIDRLHAAGFIHKPGILHRSVVLTESGAAWVERTRGYRYAGDDDDAA